MKKLLALLLFASPLAAQEQSVEVHGLMGSVAGLASDAGVGIEPFIAIEVKVPVADSFYAPSVVVTPILTALPGQDITFETQSFKGIEFGVGLSQPLSKKLRFSLYGEVGFASRMPGKTEPLDKTARWAAGGIRFEGSRGLLAVLIGADQRLTGIAQPAVLVNGVLSLATLGKFNMSLVGSAILGIEAPAYGYPATKDVVRVGISAGL